LPQPRWRYGAPGPPGSWVQPVVVPVTAPLLGDSPMLLNAAIV
jgi:hypothetical protein